MIFVAAVTVRFVVVDVVLVWCAGNRTILETYFQVNRRMLLQLCPALCVNVCGLVHLFCVCMTLCVLCLALASVFFPN